MSRESQHPHTGQFVSVTVWEATRKARTGFAWKWNDWASGHVVVFCHKEQGQVTLTFSVKNDGQETNHRQTISLTYTTPNYGGRRAWFTCSTCRRRVGRLFMPINGSRLFICRHCWRLRYYSQRLAAVWRAQEKGEKLLIRLGGRRDDLAPPATKPKGMHWRTYDRLIQKWNDLTQRWAELEDEHVMRLFRRFL